MSLFADNMCVYMESPTESTKKTPRINALAKLQNTKINYISIY